MSLLSKFLPAAAAKPKPQAAAPVASERPQSVADIQAWLTQNVARRLKVDPSKIDRSDAFSQVGLDSLAAVNISAEIERWLGIELEATLLYEYSNINELSAHLAQRLEITA